MAPLHTLFAAMTVTVTFDNVAMMRDTIEQHAHQLLTARYFYAARKFRIRHEDRRNPISRQALGSDPGSGRPHQCPRT